MIFIQYNAIKRLFIGSSPCNDEWFDSNGDTIKGYSFNVINNVYHSSEFWWKYFIKCNHLLIDSMTTGIKLNPKAIYSNLIKSVSIVVCQTLKISLRTIDSIIFHNLCHCHQQAYIEPKRCCFSILLSIFSLFSYLHHTYKTPSRSGYRSRTACEMNDCCVKSIARHQKASNKLSVQCYHNNLPYK